MACRRMPVDHPGEPGHGGHARDRGSQPGLLNADLIISLGMRFDDRVTGNLAISRVMPR
jgi:thiamine pyrophosphate-dependent acetolactate synthase large subunit-like protein